MSPKLFKQRFLLITLGLSILLLAVVLKLVQLTIFGEKLLNQANLETIQTIRGNIYDRNGRILAISRPSAYVFLDPALISTKYINRGEMETVNHITLELSNLLKIEKNQILQALERSGSYVRLPRNISIEDANYIRSLQWTGVGLEYSFSRYYPYGSTTSHIIGFTGVEGQGLEGLEYTWNDSLSPLRYKTQNPQPLDQFGYSLQLTIDTRIQQICQEELKKAVEQYQAESGSIIILDAFSGEIISMVNYPDYDPNQFTEYNRQTYRNLAITDYYEPGSVFKIFAAAALIEEGLIHKDSNLYCDGKITVNNREVTCIHPHGEISFGDVLKLSCNTGMIQSMQNITKETFLNYLIQFGFGQKTGIELSGENAGSLKPIQEMTNDSKHMMAIGYEVGVTPLQLATAASAVINGGILMQPFIVKKVLQEDNALIEEYTSEPQSSGRVISRNTAIILMDMLKQVVQGGGTGEAAYIPNLEIAGKTGTANIYNPATNQFEDDVNATFLGFIPTPNSSWTAIVLIRKPTLEYLAGRISAPTFKNIVEQLINKGFLWDY